MSGMRLRRIFAQNLRRVRTGRGLSQEALAGLAGIDRTYVSSLERENYSATIDMIEKLATALGVEAMALMDPSGVAD